MDRGFGEEVLLIRHGGGAAPMAGDGAGVPVDHWERDEETGDGEVGWQA